MVLEENFDVSFDHVETYPKILIHDIICGWPSTNDDMHTDQKSKSLNYTQVK